MGFLDGVGVSGILLWERVDTKVITEELKRGHMVQERH